MDGPTFDHLVKRLTQKRLTRGGLLRGVAASAVGAVTGATLAEAAAQPKPKVTLCHNRGGPAEQTREVPHPAVAAHLGHGDTLGPCPALGTPPSACAGGECQT